MSNCVFCKIARWETPSQRVYEDNQFIAFLDINPINWGHTLVIPRKHYVNVDDTPEEVLADMIKLTKKLAPAIMKAIAADAYNIGINNYKAAGQAVDHVHIHIIPRHHDDGLKAWHGRDHYPEGKMGETARKIKEVLERAPLDNT